MPAEDVQESQKAMGLVHSGLGPVAIVTVTLMVTEEPPLPSSDRLPLLGPAVYKVSGPQG